MLVNDSMAHFNTVLAGGGVGQVLKLAAQPYLRSGQFVPLFEDFICPRNTMYVVYPPN